MKKIILGMLLVTSPVFAGDVVGNGGDGVIRNSQLYLLDLVETGRYLNPVVSKTVKPDPAVAARIVTAVGASPAGALILATKLKELETYNLGLSVSMLKAIELHQWLFINDDLANVGDEHSPLDPRTFLQIGIRQSPVIYVNTSLYAALDDVNEAAFIAHEAIYSLIKPLGDIQPSWLVRQIVNQLFSQDFSDPKATFRKDRLELLPVYNGPFNYRMETSEMFFLVQSVDGIYQDPRYGDRRKVALYPGRSTEEYENGLAELCSAKVSANQSEIKLEHSFTVLGFTLERPTASLSYFSAHYYLNKYNETGQEVTSTVKFEAGKLESCKSEMRAELRRLKIL